MKQGTTGKLSNDEASDTDSITNRLEASTAPTLTSAETNVDRPLLFIPGFGETQSGDLTPAEVQNWIRNRGLPPNQLSLEPIANAYSDIEQTFDNIGYRPDSTYFTVKWDWRMPVATSSFDNVNDDVLNSRLGDDSFDGGSGLGDRIVETIVTGSGPNLTLTGTTMVGLGNDSFKNIKAVVLTGDANNNLLDASGFTSGIGHRILADSAESRSNLGQRQSAFFAAESHGGIASPVATSAHFSESSQNARRRNRCRMHPQSRPLQRPRHAETFASSTPHRRRTLRNLRFAVVLQGATMKSIRSLSPHNIGSAHYQLRHSAVILIPHQRVDRQSV